MSAVGVYGPTLIFSGNVPSPIVLASTPVTVKNTDGSAATLYTDRTGTSTTSNITATDSQGNLTFYAAPGPYLIEYTNRIGAQSLEVEVPPTASTDSATYVPRLAQLAITSAPASAGTQDRTLILGAPADFSQTPFGGHRLTLSGTSTLGAPTSGYSYSYETAANFLIYDTGNAGHNQSTSTNDGRTAATAYRTMLYNGGAGDAIAYNAYVEVYTPTNAGLTHWLADAAGTIINGDVGITNGDHHYLNPMEFNLSDGGHDAAAIGVVLNFNRTISTAGRGEIWMGIRLQSSGSQPIEVGFSATGPMKAVLDATQATLDTNKTAIALAAQQRLVLNAGTSSINGINWYGNVAGTCWVECGGAAGGMNLQTLNGIIKHNQTQLLKTRITGWTAPTGTASRAGFDTSTATLTQVAQTVKALIDDLHGTAGHGLIGT